MTIASDNAYSIGKTPLVRLSRLTKSSTAKVLKKIEGRNPAYSVKCRIGANMIWRAEEEVKPGGEIIEPTSGNTGFGGLCVLVQQVCSSETRWRATCFCL